MKFKVHKRWVVFLTSSLSSSSSISSSSSSSFSNISISGSSINYVNRSKFYSGRN